jgi:hypothetical protein
MIGDYFGIKDSSLLINSESRLLKDLRGETVLVLVSVKT